MRPGASLVLHVAVEHQPGTLVFHFGKLKPHSGTLVFHFASLVLQLGTLVFHFATLTLHFAKLKHQTVKSFCKSGV